MPGFSKRHGYARLNDAEITVREDAPHEMRGVLIQLAYDAGLRPKVLRPIVCRVLRKRPDDDNWSEYPNIDMEIRRLVDECPWYKVYDVVEAIAAEVGDSEKFEADLNEYFIENGIGWKLENAVLIVRGPVTLERSLVEAGEALNDAGLPTAANELREAVSDLSRRPAPDVTGAIQHAMASLECVARRVCGEEKATLGDVIKRHADMIPRPLDEAITKLWGFASENARHIREGREPTYAEAELVVSVAAAAGNYLVRKNED
jgi:AbiJ N-terminal domain 4